MNKKLLSLAIVVFVFMAVIFGIHGIPKVQATPPSGITGGSAPAADIGESVAVTGMHVTGDGSTIVPVNLYVPSGTLSMTTTTGLTFTGDTSGSKLEFSGTIDDVNTALATLHFTASQSGSVVIDAALIPANTAFDPIGPDPDHPHPRLYEVITPGGEGINALDARTQAALHTQLGLTGYLVTITSQHEKDFVSQRINADSWIGASDQDLDTNSLNEGIWKWDQGPETSTQFWSGGGNGEGGSVVGGLYNNWSGGEPNNSGNENCAEFYADSSQWNDLSCTGNNLSSYIIEYGTDNDAPAVLEATTTVAVSNNMKLSTCDQLLQIANTPNNYATANINLQNDIDCNFELGSPLFSGGTPYQGTFDGNHHTISNITLDDGEYTNYGLFSSTNGATIRNLNLSSTLDNQSSVYGYECVGALIGQAVSTSVENVTSNWNVTAYSNSAGGLVGCEYLDSNADVSLNNNTVSGDVETQQSWGAGGIVGYVYPLEESNNVGSITINSNTMHGSVGAIWDAGGIVGDAELTGTITGDISNNISDNEVSGMGDAGGIIGYAGAENSNVFTIDGNTASGDIVCIDDCGGIGGYLEAGSNNEDSPKSSMTISNSIFSGTVHAEDGSDGSDAGGIIGGMETWGSSTYSLDRNINNGSVYAKSNNAGGIIGDVDNDDSTFLMNQNINNGSVEGGENNGGLIGYLYNYGDTNGSGEATLQDSYSTGSVTNDTGGGNNANQSAGGAVGIIDPSTSNDEGVNSIVHLNNIYSSGDVSGASNVGGLVGYIGTLYWNFNNESNSKVYVDSSFSTSYVTSDDANSVGGLFGQVQYDAGVDDIHSTNNFWDLTRSGTDRCSGSVSVTFGTTNCSAVNTSNDQPNYFKVNNTREPLKTWNFDSTWGFITDLNEGLPCLRWQEGCASVPSNSSVSLNSAENNTPIQISQTDCSIIEQSSSQKETSLEVQDPAYVYPVGFANFTFTGCGASSTVTITFTGTFDPSNVVIRKYNSITHTFITLSQANSNLQLTTTTLNNQPALQVSYTIVDNGMLDQNPEVGAITDPVGIGIQAVAAPNTGFGLITP